MRKLRRYARYYNELRPHQRKENKPLLGVWQDDNELPHQEERIVCHNRLGGVLKHYERRAA